VAAITVFASPELDAPSGLIHAFGDMWFTSIGNHRIGRVRDGVVQTFTDPAIALPANIFPASDGRVWFTALGSDALGAVDPEAPEPSSTIAMYPLPEGSRPVALKSGPDGRLWFSLRGRNAVGALDPRAPLDSMQLFYSPTIAAPAALFVTSDGTVWWVNSSSGTIGMLAPSTDTVTAVPMPGSPRAWCQSTDGRLWLTTRNPAGLLSFDPDDAFNTAVPVTDSRLSAPDGVWVGRDGAVWLADTGANTIGRYLPATDTWSFLGGPPQVDGPFDIKDGPDGALWFTNKAGNTIGRITPPGPTAIGTP
jgi:virginiamycin B lyase